MEFIITRLSEPSTWRGIIWLITAFGLVLTHDQQESIVTFGMALAGLVGVFTKEKPPKPTEQQIEEIKQDIQTRVETGISKKASEKKNGKTKKSDSDNFFND